MDNTYDCDSDVSVPVSSQLSGTSQFQNDPLKAILNASSDPNINAEPQVPNLINSIDSIHSNYKATLSELQLEIDSLLDLNLKANNSLNDTQLRLNNSNIKIEELQLQMKILLNENLIYKEQIDGLNKNLIKMENSYLEQLELSNDYKNRQSKLIDYSNQLNNQLNAIELINANMKQQFESEIENLKSQIDNLNTTNDNLEFKSQAEIDRLSNYLYIQYAQKHETKVQELKALYKSKLDSRDSHYNNIINSLKHQLQTSNKEIDSVKQKLVLESTEKQKLIKLWDEYSSNASNEKRNNVDIQSFLKSIK